MEKTRQHSFVMRTLSPIPLALVCLLAAPLAAQDSFSLPSGLEVTLHEILWDDQQSLGRFRFIAPDLALPGLDGERVADDMALLCRDFALPVQRALHPGWDELVISIANAPTVFGQSAPDVVQFFEGFSAEGQDCIWSQF